MPLLNLASFQTPLVGLLLTSLLPTASAAGSVAGAVDTAGFWLGFSLVVVVSAAEPVLSVTWTRLRVPSDSIHSSEISCRICGRCVFVAPIDKLMASEIAN